jgi:hypothetical protein
LFFFVVVGDSLTHAKHTLYHELYP